MSRFQTTRLFALQVSGHDSYFAPREKPRGWRRAISYVAFTLAAILSLIPSFQIGQSIFKAPTFAVPDRVEMGSVFTIPATESEVFSIEALGEPLSFIDAPKPFFLGAVSAVPQIDVFVTYRIASRWQLKNLLPSFKHPQVPYFAKRVTVEGYVEDPLKLFERNPSSILGPQDASHSGPVALANVRNVDGASAPAPSFHLPTKVFERNDGAASVACWHAPEMKLLDLTPLQIAHRGRRLNQIPRLATLTSSARGEVIHVSPYVADTEATRLRTVVLYHGGNLYSHYSGLREVHVRQGQQVRANQVLGLMNAGTLREPASVQWGVRLGKTEVNLERFLSLSSQLCDSK